MLPRRLVAAVSSAGAVFLCAGVAFGQDYPSRPTRFITTAAGATNDFVSRVVAPGLAAALGQPVIVDNRANGVYAAEIVAKAQPDGYSLLIWGNPLWIGPLLQKMPYDP